MLIEAISLVVGFLSAFLGPAFKLWENKQDNAHELAMLDKRLERADNRDQIDLERDREKTDRQELIVVNRPRPSYAIQLVQAGLGQISGWFLYPAFMLFVVIDAMNQVVRPLIALSAFGAYIWVKYAEYQIYLRDIEDVNMAKQFTWNDNDLAILFMVLGHFFGNRVARHAFGSKQ